MVDLEQLRSYVNAGEDQDSELERALAVADALVSQALESAWRPVPEAVRDEALLRTAYNIFAHNNGEAYTSADGTGVPGVANDPLRKSRDLIRRYTDRV